MADLDGLSLCWAEDLRDLDGGPPACGTRGSPTADTCPEPS